MATPRREFDAKSRNITESMSKRVIATSMVIMISVVGVLPAVAYSLDIPSDYSRSTDSSYEYPIRAQQGDAELVLCREAFVRHIQEAKAQGQDARVKTIRKEARAKGCEIKPPQR